MNQKHLSDDELLSLLMERLAAERSRVADILELLVEVEDRRLHLDLACSSLYDFATRKLGLSEGEAIRRIRTARIARRLPQVLAPLRAGDVTMSNVLLVEKLLTPENVNQVLRLITRRRKVDVLRLVAEMSPKPDVEPSIRLVPEAGSLFASTAASSERPEHPKASVMPRSPGRHEVRFMASDALRAKIERAQELLRHRIPNGDLEAVAERAFDALLAELEKEKFGKTVRPQASPRQSEDPGHISNETKREVAARDEERCSFVGTNGERCPERGFLEFDHVQARALGGKGDVGNVRLLCRAHNQLAAERAFGQDSVERHRRQKRYGSPQPSASEPARELVQRTLVELGFRKPEADRAVAALDPLAWHRPPDVLIREALRTLT
jgi:hypothetical protein